MLLVCGNIELNPGSRKRDTCYNLSIGHWNLNSIATHNFEKVNLLEAYNTVNKFNTNQKRILIYRFYRLMII